MWITILEKKTKKSPPAWKCKSRIGSAGSYPWPVVCRGVPPDIYVGSGRGTHSWVGVHSPPERNGTRDLDTSFFERQLWKQYLPVGSTRAAKTESNNLSGKLLQYIFHLTLFQWILCPTLQSVSVTNFKFLLNLKVSSAVRMCLVTLVTMRRGTWRVMNLFKADL